MAADSDDSDSSSSDDDGNTKATVKIGDKLFKEESKNSEG